MDNLRNNDEAANLLQQSNIQAPPPNQPGDVTYAQILQTNRNLIPDNSSDQFDFRLQTPPQERAPNTVEVTSVRSSISSGYIDLTQNINRTQKRNVRPTSPETSF